MGNILIRSLARPRVRSFRRPLNRLPVRSLGRFSNKSFNYSNIPKKGIYGFTSDSGKRVKYIGASNDGIYDRLNNHIRYGRLTKNNNIFVYPMPGYTKSSIDAVEKMLISLFQPTFNKNGKGLK